MKALEILRGFLNGEIPDDMDVSKAIQELEILEIEVMELRETKKDFLEAIISAQQTIEKVINK